MFDLMQVAGYASICMQVLSRTDAYTVQYGKWIIRYRSLQSCDYVESDVPTPQGMGK